MDRKSASASLAVLLLASLFIIDSAYAQALYGTIVGSVKDATGAAVPKAHITVTNPSTGLKRETDTDVAGAYQVPNLPDGTYDVAVSAPGFRPLRQTGVDLNAGAVIRVDLPIQVGALTEEVTVSSTEMLLQTETSEVSTTIGTVPVVNLPTGFYRNFQYLQLLVPGAAENQGFTGALADTPERAIAIPMNGLSPSTNSTRIDGAESKFLWKAGGGTLYVPPIEAVQEVRITTNSYDPEKGMAGGAAVDVITKSGTNNFHGVAFWYHYNQHFTSCEPFDANCKWQSYGLAPTNKPKDILNDVGGNLGGPIKKNKLFFFANWDGVFQRNTPDGFYTVPTPDIRAGDFTAYLGRPISNCLDADWSGPGNCANVGGPIAVPMTDGHGNIIGQTQLRQGMIFDPTTGNKDGTGRAVFAAGGVVNKIPLDRFGSVARTVLGLWPTPNVPALQVDVDPDTGVRTLSRNYFLNAPQRFNRNNYDFKGDWNRNERHFIWGKYSQMNALTFVPCGFGTGIGGPCPASSDGSVHAVVHTSALGHTWTLTPRFIIDGNIGFSYMMQAGEPSDFGKNIGLDVLHIPGTNDPKDMRYSGAPTIAVGGFDSLGSPFGWMPLYRNDWSATFSQNASWTLDKHSLRFGVDIVRHHMGHWQPENGMGPRGGFNIGRGDATMLNLAGLHYDYGVGENRFNQFATFLLDRFDDTGRAIQYQRMYGNEWEYGFHFLDRYRVTQKLTLTLGVRYEYYPWMWRNGLGGGTEAYDTATNTVLLGGLGWNPRDLGISTQKNMIAPRVGFAYQLTDKTVLRAGFGSTFDTRPLLRAMRGTYPEVISNDYAYDTSNPMFNTAQGCANGPGPLCSFQGMGTFETGIPPTPLPDVSTGRIPIPPTSDIRYVAANSEFKRGRIETWNVAVERQLPLNLLLNVAYVGNRLTHGMAPLDMNASRIDEQGPLSEKYGRTAATYQLAGYLKSHYNSLQATLDRNFANGVYLKAAYTYSKAIDYTTEGAWGGSEWQPPIFAHPDYFEHNRGMADFDHRHVFRMALVWDLPVGGGRKYMNSNPIGKAVLGGWQLNGVFSAQTGAPTGMYGDPYNMLQSGNWQTLDQIGPVKKTGCLGPGENCYWYDPSSFAPVPNTCLNPNCVNKDGSPETPRQHRFGTAGRNIAVYGPGRWDLDGSLFRHFRVGEKFDMQFRAEGLNVLNHPNWNWDGTQWGNGFCWTTAAGRCTGMLQSTSASGHRIFRLGLRLAF